MGACAECDPAVLDFSAGNLAEAGKDVSAVKGFLFRNFTGSKAQRSAIASLPKVDSKDQVRSLMKKLTLQPDANLNATFAASSTSLQCVEYANQSPRGR